MTLIEENVSELNQKTSSCMIGIFISSATTLSFIFQSAFLYGYAFFLFKESRQHKIYLGYPNLASDSLCPVLPILEVYIHGVAVTSLIAFLTIGFLYSASLSPPSNGEHSSQDPANGNRTKSDTLPTTDFNHSK